MATENQQATPEESTSEVPPDHELFAGEVHEEPSEREIFAGDEDFYGRLADSAQATAAEQPVDTSRIPLAPIAIKRFSSLQKILAVSIVVIGTMLLYALLKSPLAPVTSPAPAPTARIRPTARITPAAQQTSPPELPVEDSAQAVPQQIQKPEPPLPQSQPLSLKVAEAFYLNKDYNKAYAAYDQLRQGLPTGPEEQLLKDFLQLRMALCMKKAADSEQANRLFRMVSKSRSPVVRAMANYHRSLLEIQKKQYLKARTRAYQTIALIGAVDWATFRNSSQNGNPFDRQQLLSLQQDCQFLVAESMTGNVISLCDADKDLPEDLWSSSSNIDPFTNLSETQLRSLLNSGSGQLTKGLLGPKIQKLTYHSASQASQSQHTGVGLPPRFSVICHGASIEELLARFAANAGLDIHWATGPDSIWIRKRPVTLYLPAATTQQFVSVAAGCVGLLARLDDNRNVNIFNPADYSSLSEHVSLLSQEAISLWQRFLLTFHDDERIPSAHFALGLLQSQKGRPADAIAEYKLVANRFSHTSLAPFALLQSSKLKTNLRDYFGARQDLKQLTEQYPDAEIAGQACLYLADATMKARLYGEAARLYRKVYNLDLSLESQTASALGAARCFYEKKDHESAAKWLTRYIDLARQRPSTRLYSAYFLLGKTNLALGKPRKACEAFQYALGGELTNQEYVETVTALVKGHMNQENFVEALDILEDVRSVVFSQKESVEILLLKSKTLRAMGLVDKAITALADRTQYLSDPQLKAKVSLELTKCYIAKGNFKRAYSTLTEILVTLDPGPLAHESALELADVCLKLGQSSQTISICSQLLDLGPSAPIKQKTLDLLATAYSWQKNYDRAALTLLGRWNETETPNEEGTSDRPAITDQSLHRAQ